MSQLNQKATAIEVRARTDETLRLYTAAMLKEILRNRHKGWWYGANHARELDYHVGKLKAAVKAGCPPERIIEFAADVGNCAYMWLDDLGYLTPDRIYDLANERGYVAPPKRMWRHMPRKHLALKLLNMLQRRL